MPEGTGKGASLEEALDALKEAARDWVEIDDLTSPPCTAEMLKASNLDLFKAVRAFVAAEEAALTHPTEPPSAGREGGSQSRRRSSPGTRPKHTWRNTLPTPSSRLHDLEGSDEEEWFRRSARE